MAGGKRKIPDDVRREVLTRYGARPGMPWLAIECHYCPVTGGVAWNLSPSWPTVVDLEFDHVRPAFRGGQDAASNVVLACRRCNRSKGHKTVEEWLG
jgi:5-methylcytosine-specific restriction endonuclease McrA